MTDDEAAKVLRAERNYYQEPELIWLALTHALQAIEDREALVAASAGHLQGMIGHSGWEWKASLEQTVYAARRHMEGQS